MKERIVIDTGPLVAFLNRRDRYHEWVKVQWSEIIPPLFTCEAVISEVLFLLRNYESAKNSIFELFKRNILQIPFRFADHEENVEILVTKYSNIPMSFADACLVRMSEVYPHVRVLTLDTDFKIYRRNKNEVIPILLPPEG
jgi:uncharacterized protein